MKDLGFYEWIALTVLLIGGINWGLIGLLNVNLFSALFGAGFLNRLICIGVGIAAGYLCYSIYQAKKRPI